MIAEIGLGDNDEHVELAKKLLLKAESKHCQNKCYLRFLGTFEFETNTGGFYLILESMPSKLITI